MTIRETWRAFNSLGRYELDVSAYDLGRFPRGRVGWSCMRCATFTALSKASRVAAIRADITI